MFWCANCKVDGMRPSFPVERIIRPMLRHSLFFAICLAVITVTSIAAQSITSGDITGTITDPSGAAVPSAAVTLVNVSTNATENAVSTQQGSYRFAFVPRGSYTVKVTA